MELPFFLMKMSKASLTPAPGPSRPFVHFPYHAAFIKEACTVYTCARARTGQTTLTHTLASAVLSCNCPAAVAHSEFLWFGSRQLNFTPDRFDASLYVSGALGAVFSSSLRVKMPKKQEITSVEMKGPSSRQVTESPTRACQCFTAKLNVFSVGRPTWCHRQLPQHPLPGDSGRKLFVPEEGHCERYPHRPQVSTNLPPLLLFTLHTVTCDLSC